MRKTITAKGGSQMGFVSIAYLRSLYDYLSERGHRPEVMFGATMARRVAASDSRARIPALQWVEMFEKAIDATADPHLALHVGEAVKPRHYGMLGYVIMTCATLGEVVDRLLRYERLAGGLSHQSVLDDRGESVELRWRSTLQPRPPAVLAETSLAAWVSYGRCILGRHLVVETASFQHPAPADTREYSRIFGGPVLFSQPCTALVFRREYLDLPLVEADAELKALLDRQVSTRLRELAAGSFDGRLQAAVRRAVEQGAPRLEVVAGDLGLHPRTLQRELKARGLSFQSLLDEMRCAIAQELLRQDGLSLLEVAFMLGFSEQSAFQRAFKRWTGQTPGRWRRCDEKTGLALS